MGKNEICQKHKAMSGEMRANGKKPTTRARNNKYKEIDNFFHA